MKIVSPKLSIIGFYINKCCITEIQAGINLHWLLPFHIFNEQTVVRGYKTLLNNA